MNKKLERLNILIRYLIWREKISFLSPQKDISERIGANKVSISNALNGNEKYLTDKLIERINNAYEREFNIEWLLRGEGEAGYSNFQTSENNSGTGIIGNNVNGGGINDNKIILEMVELLKKKDEQIDRLLNIIEKLNTKNY